jgi:hypothetical protein
LGDFPEIAGIDNKGRFAAKLAPVVNFCAKEIA